jgi:hypothetical protein
MIAAGPMKDIKNKDHDNGTHEQRHSKTVPSGVYTKVPPMILSKKPPMLLLAKFSDNNALMSERVLLQVLGISDWGIKRG